jgi:hypothetical protein
LLDECDPWRRAHHRDFTSLRLITFRRHSVTTSRVHLDYSVLLYLLATVVFGKGSDCGS